MPQEAMVELFEAQPANDLPQGPNYNVCPTTQVPVVSSETQAGGGRRLRPMRWGFLPRWYKSPTDGPLLINARAETIAEKPAFRAACRERRCILPASGFYEWTKDDDGARLPWYIRRSDEAPMALAGIWQDWRSPEDETVLTTCAVVTCAAAGAMAGIHHRMPVILERADWPLWLGEAGKGAAPLMKPSREGTLAFHRVDKRVNSNRASGPELIEPLEDEEG